MIRKTRTHRGFSRAFLLGALICVRAFENLGLALQLLHQIFLGGGTDNIDELPTSVVDQTYAIHHDVIHTPFPGLTQQSIIHRDFTFAREVFSLNFRIVALMALAEVRGPFLLNIPQSSPCRSGQEAAETARRNSCLCVSFNLWKDTAGLRYRLDIMLSNLTSPRSYNPGS